jgi:hypothetical protein
LTRQQLTPRVNQRGHKPQLARRGAQMRLRRWHMRGMQRRRDVLRCRAPWTGACTFPRYARFHVAQVAGAGLQQAVLPLKPTPRGHRFVGKGMMPPCGALRCSRGNSRKPLCERSGRSLVSRMRCSGLGQRASADPRLVHRWSGIARTSGCIVLAARGSASDQRGFAGPSHADSVSEQKSAPSRAVVPCSHVSRDDILSRCQAKSWC